MNIKKKQYHFVKRGIAVGVLTVALLMGQAHTTKIFAQAENDEEAMPVETTGQEELLNDIIPLAVHSHDGIEWTEAASLPTSSGNYYLTGNITVSSDWTVPAGTINLCLAGYKITITGGNIKVPSGSTLNIFDCSNDSSGCIERTDESSSSYQYNKTVIYISANGNVTIHNGKIIGTQLGIYSYGNLQISNGTVIANNGAGIYNYEGNLTVSAGRIESSTSNAIQNWRGNIDIKGGTIISGKANPTSNAIYSNGGSFKLSGAPDLEGGYEDDIYLYNSYITITGPLTNSKKYRVAIGVQNLWFEPFTNTEKSLVGYNSVEKFEAANNYYINRHYFEVVLNEENQLVFREKEYTITYDPGMYGEGEITPTTKKHISASCTLSQNTFTRTGYIQTGWATVDGGSKAYELGDKYTENKSLTLYPAWEANKYTVTFDYQGATESNETESKQVTFDSAYGELPTPVKPGLQFDGWYTEAEGGTKVTSSTIVTISTDHTLYAHWVKEAPVIDAGNIDKEIQAGENAPEITIPMDTAKLADAVLTEEEKRMVENGANIKILLTVEDAGNTVSAEDKQKVEAASGEYVIGQYLNIELLKVINGSRSNITATNQPIPIVISIPDNLKGTGNRTYAIIRVHDGVVTVLKDMDDNSNTITIETDLFSTYAIVYAEEEATNAGSKTEEETTIASPKTGDSATPELYAVLSMAAGLSLLGFLFKYKKIK